MKKATKLRLLGGTVILFLLCFIEHFNISGMPTVALIFGFAIGYEILIVGPHVKGRGNN
jgi:hypothetical protein